MYSANSKVTRFLSRGLVGRCPGCELVCRPVLYDKYIGGLAVVLETKKPTRGQGMFVFRNGPVQVRDYLWYHDVMHFSKGLDHQLATVIVLRANHALDDGVEAAP